LKGGTLRKIYRLAREGESWRTRINEEVKDYYKRQIM
jgi:uncharacterized protein (DUF4415 family)